MTYKLLLSPNPHRSRTLLAVVVQSLLIYKEAPLDVDGKLLILHLSCYDRMVWFLRERKARKIKKNENEMEVEGIIKSWLQNIKKNHKCNKMFLFFLYVALYADKMR